MLIPPVTTSCKAPTPHYGVGFLIVSILCICGSASNIISLGINSGTDAVTQTSLPPNVLVSLNQVDNTITTLAPNGAEITDCKFNRSYLSSNVAYAATSFGGCDLLVIYVNYQWQIVQTCKVQTHLADLPYCIETIIDVVGMGTFWYFEALTSSPSCFDGSLMGIVQNQLDNSVFTVLLELIALSDGALVFNATRLAPLLSSDYGSTGLGAALTKTLDLLYLREDLNSKYSVLVWTSFCENWASGTQDNYGEYPFDTQCPWGVHGIAFVCDENSGLNVSGTFLLCQDRWLYTMLEMYTGQVAFSFTTAVFWISELRFLYYRSTCFVPHNEKNVGLPIGIGVGVGCFVLGAFVIALLASVWVWKRSQNQMNSEIALDPMSIISQQSRRDPSIQLTGYILVSPADFELEVSPTDKLTFNLGTHQAAVGVLLEDEFKVSNHTRKKIKFQVLTPKSEKYTLKFEPQECELKSETEVTVVAQMTILCTTVIETDIFIKNDTGENTPSQKNNHYTYLKVKLESSVSTTLDPDEIEILGDIGEGAYSVVQRGKWRGQEVAVKILKNQKGAGAMTDFLQEVRTLESVRCPQIVRFIGAVKIPGKNAIITEFFPLGNLTSCMKHHGPFSLKLKLKCILDCAKGMAFLHQINVLHRDLKPDNLLVSNLNVDSDVNCKINDFGTSRDISKLEETQFFTVGVGTPVYMAPELLSSGKYNDKADVYSFAVLCWEIFSEKTPFTNLGSVWKITEFVVGGQRLPLDGFPPFLESIISQCWSHDYHTRPKFSQIVSVLAAQHGNS
ncbi:protein serine/threonine kinase [Pelomyxa schiedti]|nr:protein serine/threonine kinase [Pelomyxa schiedti]